METLWLTTDTFGFIAATVFFLSLMTRAPEGIRHFYIITAAKIGFGYLLLTNRQTLSEAVGGVQANRVR